MKKLSYTFLLLSSFLFSNSALSDDWYIDGFQGLYDSSSASSSCQLWFDAKKPGYGTLFDHLTVDYINNNTFFCNARMSGGSIYKFVYAKRIPLVLCADGSEAVNNDLMNCEENCTGFWSNITNICWPSQAVADCAESGGSYNTISGVCDCGTDRTLMGSVCIDQGTNCAGGYTDLDPTQAGTQCNCADGYPPPSQAVGTHNQSYIQSACDRALNPDGCPADYTRNVITGECETPYQVTPDCDDGFLLPDGTCSMPQTDPDPTTDPTCPNGDTPDSNGDCFTQACPDGSPADMNGNCITTPSCPSGTTMNNHGDCVIDQLVCPDGSRPDSNNNCVTTQQCPDGSQPNAQGNCASNVCPDGSQPDITGNCVTQFTCPDGSRPAANGNCITDQTCANGQLPDVNGNCVTSQTCPDGSTPVNGQCSQAGTCPSGSTMTNGSCVGDTSCPPDSVENDSGQCISTSECPAGTTMNPDSNMCESGGTGETSGGDSCDAEPQCSGDPLQCMIIKQQWLSRCATVENMLERSTDEFDKEGAVQTLKDESETKKEEMLEIINTIRSEAGALFGYSMPASSSSLPSNEVTLYGYTVDFSWSKFESYLVDIGAAFVALSLFIAFIILVRT